MFADNICTDEEVVRLKSHIRHIYTKVNVHNRQELLDLVFPQQM